MYCKRCGKKIEDGQMFCTGCGTPVNSTVAKTSNHKKFIIAAAVTTAVIIAAVVVGISYHNSSNYSLKKLLNAGDVQKISEVYSKKYSGSYEKRIEFMDVVFEVLEENYNAYNNNQIEYEKTQIPLEIAATFVEPYSSESDIYSDFEDKLEEYDDKFEELKDSKTAFTAGENYLSQGEYGNAIDSLEEVIAVDTNYSAAQQNIETAKQSYKDSVLQDVSQKIADSDYIGAGAALSNAEEYLPNDSDITAKFSELHSEIVNNALATAEQDFSTVGYEKAIADIESAQSIVGDNAELNNALEKYKAYTPVSIYDMEATECGTKNIFRSETRKDNLNNEHKYALYTRHNGFYSGNAYEVYPLLGKYDTLTFEAYRNSEHKSNPSVSCKINIYGDGVLLKSLQIDSNFTPQTYSLDITGVQKLKIEFEEIGSKSGYLPGEIANVIVKKTK